MNETKILAIIPARGGSKSIPNKNLKKLAGKPLVAYPIELAKSIPAVSKVVVSTDSEAIAEVVLEYGAEVPFIRPAEIAKDDTPTLPVLVHCIDFFEKNIQFKADIILLLFPTCPFLKRETVLKALEILNNERFNSVMSVEEDYGRYWKYGKLWNKPEPFYPKRYVNRQYFKPLLRENGAIYFSRYAGIMTPSKISGKDSWLIDRNSVRLLVMDPGEIVDIDTEHDWRRAEKLILQRSGDR